MDERRAEPAPEGAQTTDTERGRTAASPREIPKKGWRDVLLRTKSELGEDDVGLVSAGVAFYLFLSVFPALAALIAIYGLVADPAQVQSQIQGWTAVPSQVRDVLASQMERQAERSSGTLGWTLVGSVLLALWSASKGMKAMMKAMNIAYDEHEDRGFLKKTGIALLFTAGALVLAIVAVFAIAVVPMLFESSGLGPVGRWAAAIASWAVLVAASLTALAAVYRWGPSRDEAEWKWVTPGAAVAIATWILVSALFSFYVARFGSYGETYGSLAGVVVMLLWLWISALAVLVGAELNAEMEHQTVRDTTVGGPEPRGERDAYVADTVGRTP